MFEHKSEADSFYFTGRIVWQASGSFLDTVQDDWENAEQEPDVKECLGSPGGIKKANNQRANGSLNSNRPSSHGVDEISVAAYRLQAQAARLQARFEARMQELAAEPSSDDAQHSLEQSSE